LESLGYIFPTSTEGVIEFEKKFKKEIQEAELEYWDNPLEILKNKSIEIFTLKNNHYTDSAGLAQAAREGKKIPDSIKKKMLEDRNNVKREK